MRALPSYRRLHPIRRAEAGAVLGAVAITLIMLSSSLAVASASLVTASGRAVSTTPLGHSSAVPLTGAELQHAPFVSSTSTPLSQNTSLKVLSDANLSATTSFTVGFNLRNAGDLANIISAQQTPGSPMFQHYLTASQEVTMFGPDPTVVQNTINYYTSLGFTLQQRGPISLSFTGSVGQADGAFHTTLANVADGMANPEVVNALPLAVPSPLAGSISSINGFEGIAQFHPTLMVDPGMVADGITTPLGSPGPSAASLGSLAMAPVTPGVDTLRTNESVAYNYSDQNFYWYNYFSHFYNQERWDQVITPASLNYMYNVDPLLSAGYNGNSTPSKQITIAIVMAGGINPGDMEGYSSMVFNNPHQLIDRIHPITVDRTSGLNGTSTWTDGASNEMALDLEYSGTAAPGAKLEPVYGPCLCTNVLDDDYAAIFNLGTLPNIVSNSWGGEEDGAGPFGAGSVTGPNWQNDQIMHNYFMLIVARGATILASSGDGGGFDVNSGILSGSFPATDPYVLSVDGIRTAAASASGAIFPNPSTYGLANISLSLAIKTNYPVHVNTASQIAYQSYWYVPFSNTTLYSAQPEASGGLGTSSWFNQTWWQHAPTAPDLGRALGSGVSAEADFNESIYFSGSFELGYGGTSFACPTTAGMLADILDYFQDHGGKPYLGVGDVPTFLVGNAWENHNLTLNPYFDVTNGTSFWGNHGVLNSWAWPAGQKFPHDTRGNVNYGNATTGWDFPTGWGVINAWNFAVDLTYLYNLPSQIVTMNAGGSAIDPSVWANLATNHSYIFHVNASGSLLASHPTVEVSFAGESGVTSTPILAKQAVYPVLTSASGGYTFTLNTGTAPIDSPGLLVFTVGNATDPTAGFAYDWVSWALPASGSLQIQVVAPGGSTIPGGSATFGAGIPFFFIPLQAAPEGPNGENMVLVRVTFNGTGVYDAVVTGQIASPYDLALQGSRAENTSQSYGAANTPLSKTVSSSFTNITGYAYVWTWNVIKPTNLFINATYSTASASTNYTMVPPPNIGTTDNAGGKYSEWNWIAWILYATRQPVTKKLESLWAPNSLNQSGWYDMLYAWQGEQFKVHVNDWQGNNLSGIKVWFGNYDTGSTNKFYDYEASDGVIGYTNDTQSANTTDESGNSYIQIPQNESMSSANPYFGSGPYNFVDGPATFAAIAADIPGQTNSTVTIAQQCPSPGNFKVNILLTCVYNDSVRRNYTSTPVMVMPDPVFAWTQTPTGIQRNFFASGSNISFGVTASLPINDPIATGFGYNWAPGAYHVTNVSAYVDGRYAGQANPAPNNQLQFYNATNNLTVRNLANGIHELEVIVDVSSGQIFTYTHRFIVGSISFGDLNIQNTYTQIPYNLNWTVNLPTNQINNHTFSQSLEVQYVVGGCSGRANPCPTVVNLTEKIHDGVQNYNQSINLTMLNLNNFYGGAGGLPAGQYLITLWLNANKSGNVTAQLPTYLVFANVNGTFTGPTNHEVVPLGNVTISYSYVGGYLSNASLFVFAQGKDVEPVFTTGIFVPGFGTNVRAGSANWFATVPGAYRLVLDLGTPYTHENFTEWINVTLFNSNTYQNTSKPITALDGMSPATIGTALALVGAILGFLVGLFVAPAFRGAPTASTTPKTARPWEEMGGGGASANTPECSVCHEHFSTPFALHAHQKSAHGIEE